MKALSVDSDHKAADALLLDAALQSVPYGFCVWSPNFKLVMFNQHYLDIYGFPTRRVRKGMTLEAVVNLSSEMGNHPDQSPEEFLAAYKKELLGNRGGARSKVRERVAGDRWLETAHAFSPGLGWVVTHEDVTERERAIEALEAIPGPRSMHVYVGGHPDLPPASMPGMVRFLRRALAG